MSESPEVFPLGQAYPKKERMLELQVISFINEAFHRKKKKERERETSEKAKITKHRFIPCL